MNGFSISNTLVINKIPFNNYTSDQKSDQNIKEKEWSQESWYYVIEKAFDLYNKTLPELKEFKTELAKED